MKIGLSYSRCVRDIIDGKVALRDVLVIVARTDFDPRNDKQWAGIWSGYGGGQTFGSPYSNPEWMDYPAEDEQKFRDITLELHESGKLHQPRQYGAHPPRLNYYWLDCVVPQNEMTPAQQKAWDNYQLITGLSHKPVEFKDDF
jgi:hypothetical protein